MHLLACIPEESDDTDMMRRASAYGLVPPPLSSQYLGRERTGGLLLKFANVPQTQAAEMAELLRRALHGGD
jgi:DNA-binding transcriptional MocR family regulator